MYRQSEKNLLNSNISRRCPHNMANFGPLMAEIGSGVWGTPANFDSICVLASLLHWRHSTEVNQALHDVWLSPMLVHYTYIFGGSYPLTEFCQLQYLLFCIQVLHSPILAALLHGARAEGITQTAGFSNIYDSSAITLGIGPYSNFDLFLFRTFKTQSQYVSLHMSLKWLRQLA